MDIRNQTIDRPAFIRILLQGYQAELEALTDDELKQHIDALVFTRSLTQDQWRKLMGRGINVKD